MINLYSYYLTNLLISKLLEEPKNHIDAWDWQHPEWRNKDENQPNTIVASPNNPYSRYCEAKGLPFGTEIFPLSSEKIYIITALELSVHYLGCLAGAVEGIARACLSTPIFLLKGVYAAPIVRNMTPLKVSNAIHLAAEKIHNPFINLWGSLGSIIKLAIMILLTPGALSKADIRSIRGHYEECQREIAEIEGGYVPLWKIYQQMNKA